ncbi:hypothetical protein B566_EDAN007370 [Ephemera danica]|nr:hypothetical protein B566_EDAN007370 [Ephemera danica]
MHWTVQLEGGPRRVNHAAVAVADKIYSFGGYCTGENYRQKRPIDVHILHTVNYRWEQLPIPPRSDIGRPYQRYGHTVIAYGDKIFLWGGRNDDAACNILYCFDTVSKSWSRPPVHGKIPGARDGHSACVIDHCMYVFGGFEEDVDRFSQDVHKLDLRTFTWSHIITLGEAPSFRDFHTASAIGPCMYVFGGRGDEMGPYHSQSDVYCNNIMFLDTRSQRWHRPVTQGEPPAGRRIVYQGELYVFGGYNGNVDEHYNDLHRFNPEHNCWTQLRVKGRGPCKRRRQSCCLVGSRVFLFGGTSPFLNAEEVQEDYVALMDGSDNRLQDHNDLHVLDFAPSLMTLCLLTVIKLRIPYKDLPEDICWELRMMTTHNSISRPLTSTG